MWKKLIWEGEDKKTKVSKEESNKPNEGSKRLVVEEKKIEWEGEKERE